MKHYISDAVEDGLNVFAGVGIEHVPLSRDSGQEADFSGTLTLALAIDLLKTDVFHDSVVARRVLQ